MAEDVANNPNSETVYDLSDNTWTQKTSVGPSARYQHAMASLGEGQVLLFGGSDGTVLSGDTWVYDLSTNTWTSRTPAKAPSARSFHAMAYLGEDQVLLFGGNTGSVNDETWLAAGFYNQAPVADAGPDESMSTLAPVTLDGSGSIDPDGDLPLSYFWTQTGGPPVTFTPHLSMTTFTAPGDPAVLTFTLTVTDSLGLPDPTPDGGGADQPPPAADWVLPTVLRCLWSRWTAAGTDGRRPPPSYF